MVKARKKKEPDYLDGQMLQKPEPVAWEREKLAKLNADIYYLEGWFSRASWPKKSHFLLTLVKSLDNEPALKQLLLALRPLLKDTYYAKSHVTKCSFDAVPNDNDRNLDVVILEKVMNDDLMWLKSLNESDKINILLDLIKLGGSELARIAYNEATTLINILQFITCLEKKYVKKEVEIPVKFKNIIGSSKLLKQIRANENIIPLIDEYKVYLSLKPNLNKLPKYKNALKAVFTKQKLWDAQLKRVINSSRTGSYTSHKVVNTRENIDRLQLLPLWINRQIIKLLDKEDRNRLSRVNRYWRYTVEEVIREEEVRKNLNSIIQKMELKLASVKLPGQKFTLFGRKLKKSKSVEHIFNKKTSSIKRTKSMDLQLLIGGNINIKESIFSLIQKERKSKNPFKGLYNDMLINTAYMYDRSVDCTRKWIATSDNAEVVLYSLITGTKSKFILTGHTLVVTCLAFFPQSFRIATGSLDQTIKTWDLWNRKVIKTFLGHTGVILSISVNEEYLVSCAFDVTIRIFSHKDGICIRLIDKQVCIPALLVLSLDNIIYVAGIDGSLHRFSIKDKNAHMIIPIAHLNDITYIGKFGLLIVTASWDFYVRLWNENFSTRKYLLQIYHEKKVNSVVLCHSTLITACEDGILRFWSIDDGKLFRKIIVNLAQLPIISLCYQDYYNHIKIVCNNEANIYVIEFRYKWFKKKKCNNPYQGLFLYPINESNKLTSLQEKRLIELHKRKCTLPQIRASGDYKLITDSLLKNSITDKRDIESFPRFDVVDIETTENYIESENEEDILSFDAKYSDFGSYMENTEEPDQL